MTAETERLREQLAAIQHQGWSHWQWYVHSCLQRTEFFPTRHGSRIGNAVHVAWVMSDEDHDRWERQIATPYADLTDAEKASDLEQVDRYWPIITALIAERNEARRVAKKIQQQWEDALEALAAERARLVARYGETAP